MIRVCVAGGGPAGLTAAIFAAHAGAEVLVVEKNTRCGVKLLTTGGGHCNVTNTRPESEWPPLFGKRGRFIVPALENMPRSRLESWLTEMGQPVRCTDGRHVFPVSNSARAVRDALVAEAERSGVRFAYAKRVTGLSWKDGVLTGVSTETDFIECDRVILASGGKSYPATGSTWDGVRLAAASEHRFSAPYPGLVGLNADNLDASLAGLVLPDALAFVKFKGAGVVSGRGELLFTHGGVSGPAILDMSGRVAEGINGGNTAVVKMRWLADVPAGVWRERLLGWKKKCGSSLPATLVKEFLPMRLARWLCDRAGVGADISMARLTSAALELLAEYLGEFPVTITGTQGWDKAMVTRGGIDVREIDPRTMESKIRHGLFFAGEMIDMDGPCGGYNLHWAFASGALAGAGAACP